MCYPNQHVFPFLLNAALTGDCMGNSVQQISINLQLQKITPELDNFLVALVAGSLSSKTVWCCIWFQ